MKKPKLVYRYSKPSAAALAFKKAMIESRVSCDVLRSLLDIDVVELTEDVPRLSKATWRRLMEYLPEVKLETKKHELLQEGRRRLGDLSLEDLRDFMEWAELLKSRRGQLLCGKTHGGK